MNHHPISMSRPAGRRRLNRLPLASAISAILAGAPAAYAASDAAVEGLDEIVVTAQKKVENLQNVPISIEVLDGQKLEQLNITNQDDFVKFSPSVSMVRAGGSTNNGQPGNTKIYIRGVASGGDGGTSGPQPSVGTYLDEQPVTTIIGTPDVHLYDIQRIEVLEGPQGTLYGASSESGTIRILTNKPDTSKFEAGYNVTGNHIQHGGNGWTAEGFVNIPLSSIAAIRLVGWDEHDGGYINNIAGTNASACIQNGVRTFPTWSGQPGAACPPTGVVGAGAINNAAFVSDNYNTVEKRGGRAALKLDLGDHWTVTPTVMGQSDATNGFFGYDPAVGNLDIVHFSPENSQESFVQSALTVEGKFSNFDLTYSGGYMKRTTHAIGDYSDYSVFYDRIYGSGAFWIGNDGNPIDPQAMVVNRSYFEKWNHELRLSTPQDLPVKGTIGAFIQRQTHDIWQQFVFPGYGFTNPYGNPASPTPNPNGLADDLSIPSISNTTWLTDEQRVDRDKAVFFQGTWDINSQWALNGGLRYFQYDNTLQGFFGYSAAFDALTGYSSGAANCFAPASTHYAPCTDLEKEAKDSGSIPRVNLTYKITPDKLVYVTYSKGFRPGGVNRTFVGNIGPYQADFLTNYEAGWKTQWLDHRLRWNGAAFWEDWKNFQFSFTGQNGLGIIANGGNARIKGIENEIQFAATNALTLSLNFTWLDARLTENYCGQEGVTNCPDLVTNEAFGPALIGPQAPAGTNLPITPRFKGNAVARYSFDEIGGWKPYAQGSIVYQTQTTPALRLDEARAVGIQPAYALIDFAAGATLNNLTVQLFVSNVADRLAQLSRYTAGNPGVVDQVYVSPAQPRTITIGFGQKF